MHECKECKNKVLRIYTGKNRSDGHRIYFDHTNREWYGNKCPNCRYASMKPKKSVRKCDGCGEKLPKARYFKCYDCKPYLPQDMGDEMYC